MFRFVLSLVAISLVATCLRRETKARPPLGDKSADNNADAVVLACTTGALDWTGAVGAAPMPEALMSAIVNFAASAYSNEVQYSQSKQFRCRQFISEQSTYAAKVRQSLIIVYRNIIYPMAFLCTNMDLIHHLSCAWDAFARRSLGLWKEMAGFTWDADDVRGSIARQNTKMEECTEVVADIVELYRELFTKAWETANEIRGKFLRDKSTTTTNRPQPKILRDQSTATKSYEYILNSFLQTLRGKEQTGLFSRISAIFCRPVQEKLDRVCRKFGSAFVDESEIAKLKTEAKKIP